MVWGMGATQSHERPSRAEPAPALASAPAAEGSSALIADRYRLIARLHAGTGGVLYRAEDIAFARPVALRMLTPALSRDETVLERLQARLKTSTSMARDDVEASGDILDLIDLGRAENGQVFVVTELLTGDNLATLIARDGPMPWQSARPLMVRACQILHLSHQHGLLRLDLQTRHLFPVRDKTQTSTLKILSPGIGDVFGDSLWSNLDPASAARQLRYAAPEQLTGGHVDARTDVYALGIIMYELLCGHVPFSDPRPAYVCARHLLEQPPPFPVRVLAKVPREVVGIVGRALAKAPADRWPTMRAFANAMAAIDFGPCDVSGTLEVGAAQLPPTASGSSPSMRIDPAAGHAPSPAVLPRTLPPLRDAFSVASTERSSEARAIDERAQAYERWFKGSQELGTPVTGSSSEMAWEEILAAAEEAVAAVASSPGSGTAGDSGVFIPERLLHSGEAATASMVRGRRPMLGTGSPLRGAAATRMSATPQAPRAGAQAAAGRTPAPVDLAEAAAASTTLQLGPEDLHGIDSPAGDSAADLPLGARPPSGGPAPGESAASLRELAAHSAPVWAVSTTEAAAPRRALPLAWAAAALLTVAAIAGGLRWLRPDATAPVNVAAPIASVPESARARPQQWSVRPSTPAALTVGSMAAPSQWIESADSFGSADDLALEADPTARPDLSPGTAVGAIEAPTPTTAAGAIEAAAPGTAVGAAEAPAPTTPAPTSAPSTVESAASTSVDPTSPGAPPLARTGKRRPAPVSGAPAAPADSARKDPAPTEGAPTEGASQAGPTEGASKAPTEGASKDAGPTEAPAGPDSPGPRKTLPGTRPPDAGHDADPGEPPAVPEGPTPS